MSEVLKPYYYSIDDTITVTGNNSTLKEALKGDSVKFLTGKFIDKIDELLKKPGSSETFRFLLKSVADNTLSTTIQSFTISDETLKDIVGGTAKDVGLWIISNLFPQSRIVALAVGALSVGENLIWAGIEKVGELVSESDIINLMYGTAPVDIQIVDQNNNVIGGALFEEGLSEEQELEAIQKLLGHTLLTRFPDISIGRDRIRVVEDTAFFPREKEYKVYDGRFVDVISQELGIAKEELLGLGQENSPNTNAQIYYESSITYNSNSFVFASYENRFFVPLPNTNGGVFPVGLHPGNIIAGSRENDILDAFQDRDPDLLFNKQNVLLLGLEGHDIINGNVEDDIIVGGKGNDTIDGGLGEDIVIFSDELKNYEYLVLENGTVIFSHVRGIRTDAVDTLKNIEFAKFQDQIVSLPLEEPEPQQDLREKSITLKFSAVLNEAFSSTYLNPSFGLGSNPRIELTYTINSENTVPSNIISGDQRYENITGILRINEQETILSNGKLLLANTYPTLNDRYEISFPFPNFSRVFLSFFNSPNGKTVEENFFVEEEDVFKDTNFSAVDFFDLRILLGSTLVLSVNEFSYRDSPRTPFDVSVESIQIANRLPLAVDNFSDVEAGKNLIISAPELLLNDSDPDKDKLIVNRVLNAVNGTVSLEGENISFIPNAGFIGAASFDYEVSDSNGGSSSATVFIDVKNSLSVGQLTGTNGRDRLTGGAGDNVLTGLGENDILNGGTGRDRLIGGTGKDILTGGADADQFVFETGRDFKRSLMGIDVVTDFQRPDKIVLDRTTFTAFRGNRVSFQLVQTVAQAKSSKALITYVRSTGALFYNQNVKAQGVGQGGQFADFKNGLNLVESDFIVQA